MNRFVRRGLSGAVGMVIGILCSILVNSTLIEICINLVFTIYFGLIFAAIGCLVLWRAYSESKNTEPPIVRRPKDSIFAHPVMSYVFSGLMIFSGLLCFVLRKDWFVGIDYRVKIPFFAFLGVSLTFIVLFLFVDCINCCAGSCNTNSRAIIEDSKQTYLIAASAVLMGFLYGLIFGILDLEDVELYRLAVMAMKDESYCYPIGIVVGGVTGVLNEIMRENNGNLVARTGQYSEEI
eukprot:TRINITY_DN8025_c0_g1_i10.p1 TRINITY_DN8025_c0_g1~~TRINITY_DN8025_c0_g1_i10.p1  ORF type:complete len:236 (+),score=40.82 TRINITY_DN8025_c0_g1_i10:23-730(+)